MLIKNSHQHRAHYSSAGFKQKSPAHFCTGLVFFILLVYVYKEKSLIQNCMRLLIKTGGGLLSRLSQYHRRWWA